MYRLTKVVNIWDEFDCGNFETKEKAIKKMNTLIKKETGQINYIREIEENNTKWAYDYGKYNRFYKIEEVIGENLL